MMRVNRLGMIVALAVSTVVAPAFAANVTVGQFYTELAAIPIVAGSVVMKPAGVAPPANSSQFVISLRPEPGWIGQFTVLGQVIDGLDLVRKISNVPTSDRPKYRPLKDIHTIHVTIQEKMPPGTPPTGSNL